MISATVSASASSASAISRVFCYEYVFRTRHQLLYSLNKALYGIILSPYYRARPPGEVSCGQHPAPPHHTSGGAPRLPRLVAASAAAAA